MNLSVFCQTFYCVFLVLMSVGPGFLTIANIAMSRGYFTSAIAVCGCFLGDCIFITLGALCANEIVNAIPELMKHILSVIAILLLLFLSIKFWKTKIEDIKARKIDKKNGFVLAITLFLLKITSPITIIGFSIIFSQILKGNSYVLSAIFGGCFGSFMANAIMVSVFGTIGKKINNKFLFIINKISAIFIFCFVCFLIYKSFKY